VGEGHDNLMIFRIRCDHKVNAPSCVRDAVQPYVCILYTLLHEL
jgi:hypothetical protein